MAAAEQGTWLVDTLGEELVGQGGAKVKTADLLDNDIVSFYFSAHWCPPCRGFTPMLAKTYKKVTEAGKKWDVVFVSSDKDQSAFDSYFENDHPWKALPYNKRDLKAKLSKKFKVQGIPTLIMLHPRTGEIWNKEGRAAIMKDQDGANFPWENKPKTFKQILEGMKLVNQNGAVDMPNKKYIAIYFSAHWCPPCKGFTPELVKWYNKYAAKFDVEIIFNSWDRDEAAFTNYFKEMPWLAKKYDDEQAKEDLNALYEVSGIPTLVVVDAATGTTVTTKGRAGVSGDPEGFPWEKKPVGKLGGAMVDALNQCPCVYVCCAEGKADAMIQALTPAAQFYEKKAREDGEWPGLMDVEFIVDDGSDGLSSRVKGLLSLKASEKLFIMDLGSKSLYNSTAKADSDVTEDFVKKFMEDYREGKLSKRSIDI